MNIYESAQDYLERILMLQKQNKPVRTIDIANDMGITKQSVHRAIKNFKENGYIVVDENNYLLLTPKGQEIAEKMYERHQVIANFFIALNVDEVTAYQDACKIEHDISEESFNALKELLKKL